MTLKPNYLEGMVHWIFECGCVYKGRRYRLKNKCLCLVHKSKLKYIMTECKECGKEFKSTHRAQKYCNPCKVKKQTKKKKDDILRCSRPGCNNIRPPHNVFLCDKCKRSQSAEVMYA